MGTSGAYGGSPGWQRVKDQTQEWLNGGADGGGAGAGPPADPSPQAPPPDIREPGPPVPTPPSISPALASIISVLGRAITSGGGGGGGAARGLTGGGGRSVARASNVGGRALGGVYGVRTGAAPTLRELGLDLAELAGLTRYQQAQRILDAAIGPRGDVLESELRKTNAEVVLWALTEEVEPTPVELANRWVVEYVWEVWITESGTSLQEHSPNSNDRVRVEQEMRAALEATVSAHALPEDRPLTTADFTAAIDDALSSLRRISGSVA